MSTTNPKTSGLVTPRYIVASVLNRLGDYSMKQYKRLLQICLEGFMELNLWHMDAGSDIIYLHMSLAKTCNLPSDFVDWLKIGYPVNGKLRAITNNENILLPGVFDTGESVGNMDSSNISDAPSNAIFFDPHWKNGQYVGGLFGLSGGIDRAYFRFNMNSSPRQIVFSGSTPRSEIVLEYQTTGLKTDGTSLIPREAVPALRTYVEWQMIGGDMLGFMTGRAQIKSAMAEIGRRKQEHEEAVAMLRSFQNSFTADEYRRVVWGTSKQSPKR
jgi:hypothetical protein